MRDGFVGVALELGQQDDALLLVGVRARDDGRYAGLSLRLIGRCGTPAGM